MSVDVSNRRFYFNESPSLESISISSATFTSKAEPGVYGYLWGRISVSTTAIYYYYRSSSYVQVYGSGAWTDEEYRTIVFAPDSTLTDVEYAWIIANATETTPYFTSNESLGQVANAIRERGWTRDLLVYPDGYDTAIRAIGNYVEGATVAWNQLASLDVADWDITRVSVSVTDQTMTFTTTSATSLKWAEFKLEYGHKYFYSAYITPPADYAAFYGIYLSSGGGQYTYRNTVAAGSAETLVQDVMAVTSTDYDSYFRYVLGTTVPLGESITSRNTMVIDLTVLLGSEVANRIYALEQDTAGAGVAAFKALFPSDYYQPQLTPVLSTVNYQNSFPVNDPVELPGVMRLDSDSSIVRYGDIYNDGKLYKRYVEIALDGLTWTYNSTYDFFYANPVGPDSTSVTGPYASDLFINAISDYLPLTLWDYGTLTESQLVSADDGMYLCYISTVQAAAINLIYIKDSTITSDHENTLLGKLAGKTIVMALTTPYYTTT